MQSLNRFLVICILFLLYACGEHHAVGRNEPPQKDASTPKHEWMRFVDSAKTFVTNTTFADSITLYFMRADAPEVMRKSRFIIWKDNVEQRTDLTQAFDLYYIVEEDHFVFLENRKKTISSSELVFSGNSVQSFVKIIYTINDDCTEIAALSIKNKTTVSAEIKDDCTGQYSSILLKNL